MLKVWRKIVPTLNVATWPNFHKILLIRLLLVTHSNNWRNPCIYCYATLCLENACRCRPTAPLNPRPSEWCDITVWWQATIAHHLYVAYTLHSTRRRRLRRLQRSRLELSAGRTPSFIADCCNVCQALENSLVLVPELAHLRIFILRYTNVLIIVIIIII